MARARFGQAKRKAWRGVPQTRSSSDAAVSSGSAETLVCVERRERITEADQLPAVLVSPADSGWDSEWTDLVADRAISRRLSEPPSEGELTCKSQPASAIVGRLDVCDPTDDG